MCTWTEQIFEHNIRPKFVVHSSEPAQTGNLAVSENATVAWKCIACDGMNRK